MVWSFYPKVGISPTKLQLSTAVKVCDIIFSSFQGWCVAFCYISAIPLPSILWWYTEDIWKCHFPVRLPTCRSRVSGHRSLRCLPTTYISFSQKCYSRLTEGFKFSKDQISTIKPGPFITNYLTHTFWPEIKKLPNLSLKTPRGCLHGQKNQFGNRRPDSSNSLSLRPWMVTNSLSL